MKVKFKNNAKTVYPKEWLEDNFKNGNIKIETLFNYNKTIRFFNTDMSYDFIFQDDKYVLVKNYLGEIICCRVEDIKMDNINIGDEVKVINEDYLYTTYADFFIENDISKDLTIRYQYGSGEVVNKDATYIVKYIGYHVWGDRKLCLIQEKFDFNRVYLIGVEGLEKV